MRRALFIILLGCASTIEGFVVRAKAPASKGRSCPTTYDSSTSDVCSSQQKHYLSMAPHSIYVDQLPTIRSKRSKGLSRDEESHYSHLIKSASRLKRESTASVHEIDPSSRRSLSIIQDGQEARDAIVAANIGLVVSIAKRYYYSCVGTILSLHDLVQEGHIGLMEAAERFEPDKGFKFSTYATWWIRQRILRSISDSSRTIRLPAHLHTTLQKIQKTRKALMLDLRREPTVAELADHLDIPAERLQKSLAYSRNVVSLELLLRSPSFKEETRTISDLLACDAPSPEEGIHAEYMKRDVLEVVNQLPDKERTVIKYRFGLNDGKPRNREETSKLLGLHRDRVRRIEARALNKLRNPQRNYRLKDYIVATGMPADKKIKVEAVPVQAEERQKWLF